MNIIRRNARQWALVIVVFAGLLLSAGARVDAQTPSVLDRGYMFIESGGVAGEPNEAQIARALAAGPGTITGNARILGADPQGNPRVLREGSNGFTCQPGNPNVIGRPASCANEAALRWSADLAAGKLSPTNTVAGLVYMLAGATQRGPSGSVTTIGPQWMIIWPIDPQTTGLSAVAKETGAYIQWSGTPYAHLHVMGQPIGAPVEHMASEHSGHLPAMGVDDDDAAEVGPGLNESAEVQMARAISAGPTHVTDGARITGRDPQGATIVLREGDNGFVCRAGSLTVVADPPQCSSTRSTPRITYMLAGATQRSISDPDDATSASRSVPPHWMIMMPFAPEATGLPTAFSDTGAYVMWSGSRSGHLHIMGIP